MARSLRSGWSGEDGGPGARPHLTAGSRPAPRGNTPRRDVRRERESGPPAGLAPASAPHAGLRVPRQAREMPARAEAAGGPSEGGGPPPRLLCSQRTTQLEALIRGELRGAQASVGTVGTV